MAMTSSRPYMIRALYDWIVDNNCTPYLLVDAHGEGVKVPQQYVNKDGQIVLNISPGAVIELSLEGTDIMFNARFGGIPTDIFVPSFSVLGIYAKENGQGMIFEHEVPPDPPSPDPSPTSEPVVSIGKRPSLRVIK